MAQSALDNQPPLGLIRDFVLVSGSDHPHTLDLKVNGATPFVDAARIFSLAAGLVVLKLTTIFALARLFGMSTRPAAEAALALAVGGEFAFVILQSAMSRSMVDSDLGKAVLVAATLTMFAIPFMIALGARIGARHVQPLNDGLELYPAFDNDGDEGGTKVLVIGFGRVGQLVGEMLGRHDVPWVAVDRDARLVQNGRREGHVLYYGDAARIEFLRRCRAEEGDVAVEFGIGQVAIGIGHQVALGVLNAGR